MESLNSKSDVLKNAAPAEFFEWTVFDDGTVRIDKYVGDAEEVVIPAEIDGKRVTVIGENSFQFSEITSIIIPEGVTRIESCAFASCSALALIKIPEGVTDIGEMAFLDCPSLTSVNIPEGVTEISGVMFAGCSSLTSIIIPDSVTRIGESAFTNCRSLSSVTLPEGVKICTNAFVGCKLLTSIKLSNGVIVDVITLSSGEKTI